MRDPERSGIFIDFDQVENDSDDEIRKFLAKRKAEKPEGDKSESKTSGERTPDKSGLRLENEAEGADFEDLKRKIEAQVAHMDQQGYQKGRIAEYHADMAKLEALGKKLSQFTSEPEYNRLNQSIAEIRGRYGAAGKRKAESKPAAAEALVESPEAREMEKLRSQAMRLVQEIEQLVDQEKMSEAEGKITRAIELRNEMGKFKNVEGYDEADEDLKFSLEMIAGKLEKLRKKEKKEAKAEQTKETEQKKLKKAYEAFKSVLDQGEAALDQGDLKKFKELETVAQKRSAEFEKYNHLKEYDPLHKEINKQLNRMEAKADRLNQQSESEPRAETPATPEPQREQIPSAPSPEQPTAPAPNPENPRGQFSEFNPEQALQLKQKREKYLEAQRRLRDASGTRGKFTGFLSKTSREAVERELEAARKEYVEARAEYVEENALRHVSEKRRLADGRMQELYPDKKGNVFKRAINKISNGIIETYKYLGSKNLEAKYGHKVKSDFMKGVLRAVNLRTAINVGLLGGAGAAFLAGGAAIGTTAWLSKRAFGGSALSVGAYMGLMGKRESGVRGRMRENLNEMSLDDVIASMAQLEAMAGYDSDKAERLAQDPEYQKLSQRYMELMAGQNLERLAAQDEAAWQKAVGNERRARNWRKAVAVGLGAFVGSGLAGELAGKAVGKLKAGWEWLQAWRGSLGGPHMPEISAPSSIMPQGPELSDMKFSDSLDVGRRGIEGALLDYKGPNADKMMEWLQAQDYNQGVTDKGALVHRWALHAAEQNGFTVDGGGKDLSWIKSADLKVGPDGGIELTMKDSDFLAPKSAPEVSVAEAGTPAPTTPESIPVDSDPDAVYETIRQTPSVELSEPPSELSEAKETLAKVESMQDEFNAEKAQREAVWQETDRMNQQVREAYADTEAKLKVDQEFRTGLRMDKTSEGLRSVLGDESGFFSKNILDIGEGDMNDLHEMSRAQFERNLAEPSFREKYEGLAKALLHPDLIKDIGADSKSMHEVILKMATNYKNR